MVPVSSTAFEDARKEGIPISYGQWEIENAVCVGFNGKGEPLFSAAGVGSRVTRADVARVMLEQVYDQVTLKPEVARAPLFWKPA